MGENFREFCVLEKNYTQKTKIYMVHTLFLTNSRKFNPAKYTTYTVSGIMNHQLDNLISQTVAGMVETAILLIPLRKFFKFNVHVL